MIDPLTAFSAAGNTLQFAELGIKIIAKAIEYSHGGGSQEHQALQDTVQRLTVSNAHLHTILQNEEKEDEDGKIILPPPGPGRALYLANRECLRVSRDFFTLLDDLKLNRYRTLWRSLRLSLRNIQKRRDLELMGQRVSDARGNLMLSLQVYLNDKTVRHYDSMKTDQIKILDEAKRAEEHSSSLAVGIQSLTKKLSKLDFSEEACIRKCTEMLHNNHRAIEDLTTRMDDVLLRLNHGLSTCVSEYRDLVPSMERELLARRRTIHSLRFPRMDDRRDRVQRAYGKTYQWIFSAKATGDVVWDDFLEWLCNKNEHASIFWIFGKPGSGKTTLMRELDERVSHEVKSHTWILQKDAMQRALHTWVGDGDLIKACCYFWYAGVAEQKSLSGLLQNLVFQLLEQRPDLVDKAVSHERWDDALSREFHPKQWTENELLSVLEEVINHTQQDDKIMFFIDGLDEQDGTDERREQMLNVLQRMSQKDHVKICVASRPWNVFRDAFERCPQLCLEDLTRDDISIFIHGKLQADNLFQKLQSRDPGLLDRVSQEIMIKARGVFLWVYLVIRDLLRVVSDGGRSVDIFEKLMSIPRDLDDYFQRMIECIDRSYRKDAAMILQLALCDMDYCQDDTYDLASGPALCLLHLEYLDTATDPCFAVTERVHLIDQYKSTEVLDDILESLARRLSSRCMGLLEVEMANWWFLRPSADPWLSKIEFLHRTVKDFLLRPAGQRMLGEHLNQAFDAHLFRCNLLIANVATSLTKDDVNRKFDSVSCLLRQVQNRPDGDNAGFILFEKMIDLMQKNLTQLKEFLESESFWRYFSAFPVLVDAIFTWEEESHSPMSMAIKLGYNTYVFSKLNREVLVKEQGRHLLDYAIRPCYTFHKDPCLQIFRKILEEGADPSEPIPAKTRKIYTETDQSSMITIPLWLYALLRIHLMAPTQRSTLTEIISVLISHEKAATIHISTFQHLIECLRDETNPLVKENEEKEALYDIWLDGLKRLTTKSSSRTSTSPNARKHKMYLSPYQVLEFLNTSPVKTPLFNEEELTQLKKLSCYDNTPQPQVHQQQNKKRSYNKRALAPQPASANESDNDNSSDSYESKRPIKRPRRNLRSNSEKKKITTTMTMTKKKRGK